MKQQDWTEQLRQRLADHEEPVPEGLWDDIEQRLQRRPRLVVLRRWMAGAAAVALLLIGGWQLLSTSDDTQSSAEELLAKAEEPESQQQSSTNNIQQKETTATSLPISHAQHVGNSTKEEQTAESTNLVETPATSTQETTQQPEMTSQNATPSQETTQQQETNPSGNSGALPHSTDQRSNPMPNLPRKAVRRPFSLQFHTTNLLANNNGITQTEPMLMNQAYMGPLSSALARTAPVYLADHEEKTEHRMPLTVGLSLRLPLSERWWLSSGINYSLVSSTFNHRLAAFTQVNDQRLHYIGVPLTAGYTFWQKPSLTAYVSTGAEAQYNLKAEVDNGHLNRDRMQFSLLGSAGIEYTFLPQLSIYVQPGLRYYPDNGSHVQNIFKERPLQFDLQLGIRYSLR